MSSGRGGASHVVPLMPDAHILTKVRYTAALCSLLGEWETTAGDSETRRKTDCISIIYHDVL